MKDRGIYTSIKKDQGSAEPVDSTLWQFPPGITGEKGQQWTDFWKADELLKDVNLDKKLPGPPGCGLMRQVGSLSLGKIVYYQTTHKLPQKLDGIRKG